MPLKKRVFDKQFQIDDTINLTLNHNQRVDALKRSEAANYAHVNIYKFQITFVDPNITNDPLGTKFFLYFLYFFLMFSSTHWLITS